MNSAAHLDGTIRDLSRLVGDGDPVLAAVSGGPDSMALLHLLRAARPGSALTAAHFDHRLRGSSARDRDHVQTTCAAWGIPCHVGSGDVGAEARARGESIETAARRLRYAFLEQTADAVGAWHIATGHTRDDDVETVLMRLRRGSGVRGLAGIPRRRGRIVRPLLSARRSDILDYCAAHGVPWVEDPSNRDTAFERNRVRHEVLPALRAAVPDADARLLGVANDARAAVAAIRRHTDAVLDAHLVREEAAVWRLPVSHLRTLDDTARYVLFGDLLYGHIGCDAELGRAHYTALSAVAAGSAAGVTLSRISVRREHDHVVFFRMTPPDRSKPPPAGAFARAAVLDLPGETTALGYRVRARVLPQMARNGSWRARTRGLWESGGEVTTAVAYFARGAVAAPFTVRPAAQGDRMRPFGMTGHKKLSDIFIDRKIPNRRRHRVPVVEDRRGVIWVAGVTTSETTRITDTDGAVVELTIELE